MYLQFLIFPVTVSPFSGSLGVGFLALQVRPSLFLLPFSVAAKAVHFHANSLALVASDILVRLGVQHTHRILVSLPVDAVPTANDMERFNEPVCEACVIPRLVLPPIIFQSFQKFFPIPIFIIACTTASPIASWKSLKFKLAGGV
jgi:hypothetical protein